MPEIIKTMVYQLEELSGEAKEAARAWYREGGFDYDWYDFVFEDFEAICEILGVQLRTRSVRLMGGGTRQQSQIFFSGFSAQGDGAFFEGAYDYAKAASRNIRAYAPRDLVLHQIADALFAVQRRNFYQLKATVRQSGGYCHAYCMSIGVDRDGPSGQVLTADAEERVKEALHDLASWLYRQLEREYEHLISDTVVDETIAVNGYTFTRSGHRFG